MQNPSLPWQLLIAAVLAAFMVVTRSPAIPGSELLHSGSWAVFFVAGVYLSSALAFPAFLVLVVVLDVVAVGWSGVAAYCLTPAYAMLLPAYGCLWAAGRWYAGHHRFGWSTLAPLAGSVVLAGIACEAFSSGGFYWLSGVFADPSMGEFLLREAQYFPAYLATLCFWVIVAALIHVGVIMARGRAVDGGVAS